MKISNIQLNTNKNFSTLSADCTIRHFGVDKLYFKFDRKYKDFIAVDASPFAAALLIPSMKMGTDLIIEDQISEELYNGLQKIMEIILKWDIHLKPIKIIAEKIQKDDHKAKKIATFFSGGVDSFYTYLKNKESKEKKIDYFILANGFDITVANKKLWESACKTVDAVAEHESIEVVKVESNVRTLTEPIISWGYTHGGALAALALALRREISDVFIASTFSYDKMFIWGSHPEIDYLWGTETLSLHHDGTEATRLKKVKFISKSKLVLDNLRVCYWNKKGAFNCGVCDKCLRTMIELYIAGALEKCTTFPTTIDLELVKRLEIEGEQSCLFQIENLTELKKMGINEPLQVALQDCINRKLSPKGSSMRVLERIRFVDHLYNRGRAYKLAVKFRNS